MGRGNVGSLDLGVVQFRLVTGDGDSELVDDLEDEVRMVRWCVERQVQVD